MFAIKCLACGREQEWSKWTDPKTSEMQIGEFLIVCPCGQVSAEGDSIIRILRPNRQPAKGFEITCNRCGNNQPLLPGLHVGGLAIGVSEAGINCDCGWHVEEKDGRLRQYWVDPMCCLD
ncbi:MAG: hypothetical protein ACYCVB_16820 [Bacilli bacterium]